MSKDGEILNTPIKLGDLELKHRIVMAPLTRVRSKLPGNIPHELNAEYYRQRATDGGLIISEATHIARSGQGYYRDPGIYSDAQVEGWKKVTAAVHEKKGLIVLQLWHVGRVSDSSYQPNGERAVAPSAVAIEHGHAYKADGSQGPYEQPREATKQDIQQIIQQYATAAKNSMKAGFDGVEIHGANGYLINQFLEDNVNKRTDEYGGSIENRARFLFEVVDAVVQAVGTPNKVGIRLSPWGVFGEMFDSDKEKLFTYVLSKLNNYKLAFVHLVEPDLNNLHLPQRQDLKTNPPTVKQLKEASKFTGNLIVCGSHTRESAIKSLTPEKEGDEKKNDRSQEGVVSAVAFGKWFIANPDLPRRLIENLELNPANPATFYGAGPEGYTDYPFYDDFVKSKKQQQQKPSEN